MAWIKNVIFHSYNHTEFIDDNGTGSYIIIPHCGSGPTRYFRNYWPKLNFLSSSRYVLHYATS